MATHSSILAWRIPGTEEPGGMPSMGSQSRTRSRAYMTTHKETGQDRKYLLSVALTTMPLGKALDVL